MDLPLPEPIYACTLLCRACRTSLLYQRKERPRILKHLYFCRRCRRRYAAAEAWSPGQNSLARGPERPLSGEG